jgi:hypothetical protein
MNTHATRWVFLLGGFAGAILLGLSAYIPGHAEGQTGAKVVSSVPRIAIADVLSVVDRLLATEKYISAQRTQVESLNRTLQPIQTEVETLASQYRAMEQTNPERPALEQVLLAKDQKLRDERQRALTQLESFKTIQAAEAYRLVVEELDRLAAESGYDLVFATRTGPVVIRSDTLVGAIQEMLARPVVRYPMADDLTGALIKRLKLDETTGASPSPNEPSPTAR